MRKIFFCMAGCVFILVSHVAHAKVTPNQVYQVTENIVLELAVFHEKNFTKANATVEALTPRKPRHVLQKAREVFQKLQALRYINGLTPNSIDPVPARAITPGDVKVLVDKILSDVKELQSVYGINASPKEAPLPSGKNPTDVYANLIRVSQSLDGLGIPAVVPNDVYQVAQTVVNQLAMIYSNAKGKDITVRKMLVQGKSPKDVYDQAFALVGTLKKLSDDGRLSVAGGVVLPTRKDNSISPSHVLDLMNVVLAEVNAMKISAGILEPTELAIMSSGKTPSDVFQLVQQSQRIVEGMLDNG